ncbi:MAG: OmpA family protein [Gammaproteobacteria bacterium]|jgi:outer membrane protein OmpA-like peptidoglycan-associated protein
MNRRKERFFVETFVMVMFPVALLVACTTNGEGTSSTVQKTAEMQRQTVTAPGVVKTSALPFGSAVPAPSSEDDASLSWSFGQKDDEVVVVSPSLHLAVYKPSQASASNVSADESVQMVNYIEPRQLEILDRYTFHFDTNEYNISADKLGELKTHAEFLKRYPSFTLTISGHTDQSGSRSYNQKLSEQRAQLIAEILKTYGVPASQLIVDGYGETVPMSENPAENRRVELEYSQALLLSSM